MGIFSNAVTAATAKVKRTDDSPPCQRTFRQFGLTRTLKNITDESVPKVTFTRKLYLSPIGEDEHDPRVELRQRLGNEVLAGLGEDGADEPQVEGVGGQTTVGSLKLDYGLIDFS